MIPTRLNQKVNDAYVAGINRSTGQLILVNNNIPIPDEWSVSAFDSTVNELAQLHPDYTLISNFEVSEIIRITTNPLVFNGIDISKNSMNEIYINTRDRLHNNADRSQIRLVLSGISKKLANAVKWRSTMPYGYFVLVKHIGVDSE